MTNHIFQTTFKDDSGSSYTIQFIPGVNTDLSTPATITLPSGVIGEELKISGSFQDGIPLGFEQARVMELSINLNNLIGTVGGISMVDVQKAIIRGRSDAKRTVSIGGVDYYYHVPNRWVLLKGSTIIYDGFQDPTPSMDIEFDADNDEVVMQITCTDIVTSLFKNCNFYQWSANCDADNLTEVGIINYMYHVKGTQEVTHYRKENKFDVYVDTIYRLYSYLNVMFDTLAPVLTRGVVTDSGLYNVLTKNVSITGDVITGYEGFLIGMLVTGDNIPASTIITDVYTSGGVNYAKMSASATLNGLQDVTVIGYQTPFGATKFNEVKRTTNNYFEKSTTDITPANTYYIHKINQNVENEIVAGVFNNYRESALNYTSVLDFINDDLRANGLKGIVNYGFADAKYFSLYKMLDEKSEKTLYGEDTVEPTYKLTINPLRKSEVSAIIKDGTQTSKLEFIDIDRGSGNDNSYEVTPFWDVTTMGLDFTMNAGSQTSPGYKLSDTFINKLFSLSTNIYQLHHHSRTNFGDGFQTADYVQSRTFPNTPGSFQPAFNYWLKIESSQFGIQRYIEKLKDIFNGETRTSAANKNLCILELTVDGSVFPITQLGNRVSLDMTEFNLNGVVLDVYGTKGIITSIEQDVIRDTSTMRVLIYG